MVYAKGIVLLFVRRNPRTMLRLAVEASLTITDVFLGLNESVRKPTYLDVLEGIAFWCRCPSQIKVSAKTFSSWPVRARGVH